MLNALSATSPEAAARSRIPEQPPRTPPPRRPAQAPPTPTAVAMASTLSTATRSVVDPDRGAIPVRLLDGGLARLRPLRAGEAGPLLDVFDGMSEMSRRHRFLVGINQLSRHMVDVLADVDGRSHVAWVATIAGRSAGVARYVRVRDKTAEVAMEVVEGDHGRGVGSALLDAVATVACSNGIARLTATVDPLNQPSLRLLNRLGLRFHLNDGLLEGEGKLLLPVPARVDRAAVLALARRKA
jgi:GNAT superfamily N-acetyltransferase